MELSKVNPTLQSFFEYFFGELYVMWCDVRDVVCGITVMPPILGLVKSSYLILSYSSSFEFWRLRARWPLREKCRQCFPGFLDISPTSSERRRSTLEKKTFYVILSCDSFSVEVHFVS